MEFKVISKEIEYLFGATEDRTDSLFYYSGQPVVELRALFMVDKEIHSLSLILISYGEVKIWDKEAKDRIDQSEIIFNIKNDEELYERIYRNNNIEIVLGNGLYITYQLDDKESVEIDSDCYEVEDLKAILKNDNSILNWYEWILKEEEKNEFQ